jgi:hypothetical protein
MATLKQKLGTYGENLIVKHINCSNCQKNKTLKKLPTNFKCADIICDFCGFLAQVKTSNVKNVNILPNAILGAGWKVQKERINEGIYFSLYLILINQNNYSIFYLSKDKQSEEIFIPRKPLSSKARRAGWQGFMYDISKIKSHFIKLS